MKHSDFITLFKDFATGHKDIQHTNDGRRSFYLMNNEAQLQQAIPVKVDYPALLLVNASGRLRRSGVVKETITAIFEIRTHVTVNDFEAIEAARSECKRIGMEIIALIDDICEDQGHCGPIHDFELDNVQWQYTGPVNQNEYGCLFYIPCTDTAYNQYTMDLDSIFTFDYARRLEDEDSLELLDFDNEPLFDA